jgi:hypothetical protein
MKIVAYDKIHNFVFDYLNSFSNSNSQYTIHM